MESPDPREFVPRRPAGRPSMRMTWHDLLFLHWRVPMEVMRPLVPAGLELDTFDGNCWVGLIPFTMTNVGHRGVPGIPTMHAFHECNVRTYVHVNGEPGVYFFSLDAASRLAAWGARRFWSLNYFHARINITRKDARIDYSLDRSGGGNAALRCSWTPGESIQPTELSRFLTERYMLYAIDGRGRVSRSRIWHAPWSLRSASLEALDDRLIATAGFERPATPPVTCWHADHLRVEVWPLRSISIG